MFEFITTIWGYKAEILAIAVQLVGVFALIASITPNQADNKIVEALYKVINFLGANFGQAHNSEVLDAAVKHVRNSQRDNFPVREADRSLASSEKKG